MRIRRCGLGAGVVPLLLVAACASSKDISAGSTVVTTTTTTTTSTTTSTTLPASTTTTVVATTSTASIAPTTTVAPATTVAPVTTVVVAPPAVTTRPIVAIDANGDAVLVAPSGAITLLFDGTDPDDPPPAEGETTAIDGVAITPDGTRAFIGVCCEPVAGSLLATTPPAVATFEGDSVFGHAPALSPDGTKLARIAYDAIVVSDVALADIAGAAWDVSAGTIYDVVFTDNDSLVAIISGPGGTTLQSYNLDGTGTLAPGPANVSPATTSTESNPPTFAGRAEGILYVAGLQDGELTAYDSSTMQRSAANDRARPDAALSAWFQDGVLRWVDENRRLHIGGLVMPGEFIWVR